MSYKIVWEIEGIDASNPKEAAEIAKDCIANGTAQCFYVQNESTNELFSVNLDEEEGDETLPVKDYQPVIENVKS